MFFLHKKVSRYSYSTQIYTVRSIIGILIRSVSFFFFYAISIIDKRELLSLARELYKERQISAAYVSYVKRKFVLLEKRVCLLTRIARFVCIINSSVADWRKLDKARRRRLIARGLAEKPDAAGCHTREITVKCVAVYAPCTYGARSTPYALTGCIVLSRMSSRIYMYVRARIASKQAEISIPMRFVPFCEQIHFHGMQNMEQRLLRCCA